MSDRLPSDDEYRIVQAFRCHLVDHWHDDGTPGVLAVFDDLDEHGQPNGRRLSFPFTAADARLLADQLLGWAEVSERRWAQIEPAPDPSRLMDDIIWSRPHEPPTLHQVPGSEVGLEFLDEMYALMDHADYPE